MMYQSVSHYVWFYISNHIFEPVKNSGFFDFLTFSRVILYIKKKKTQLDT